LFIRLWTNYAADVGRRDGQTMMVRQVNCIEAYQWSSSESRWIKVGNVVGGSNDSQTTSGSGKTHFEGKVQYCHTHTHTRARARAHTHALTPFESTFNAYLLHTHIQSILHLFISRGLSEIEHG